MSDTEPLLVYFSSATNNTKRFVEKLGFRNKRIPLRPRDEFLYVNEPYVIVVPTYGGGNIKGAVPKQVIKFLNEKSNRDHCVGIIASGNTNFGKAYCIAGDILAQKLKIPFMYKYELLGTSQDVEICRKGLSEFWQKI